MASDSQDSRRKHRRTSSDDEEHDDSIGDSKRQKHRHHHRHKHRRHHRHRHRHGHRHSSKKRDEEMKDEIEIDRKEEEVEEGEILEDDERITENKKVDSDVESGEFKDDSYTSPADSNRKSSNYTKPTGSDKSDGSKKHGSQPHRDEVSMSGNVVNGDSRDRSRKDESRSRRRSKSPSKRSSKEKGFCGSGIRQQSVDLMDVDEDVYSDRRNLLSSKVSENRPKASSRSPSHSRCHMEISDRSRSVSPDRMRRRERSQSISKLRLDHERDAVLYDNGKVHHELEDERDSRRSTDYRLDGRDIIKDKGRERSSSYHRSSMHGSKDEGGESWNREREEKLHRDKRRVKEHEVSRERYERDNDRDRNSDKTRDRSQIRDHREREPEKVRSKAIETRSDMDWDRERDRERRRDKDRGRSRDRALDRERRRDNSRASYRDRDAEIGRDAKLRDRDRKLEMDRERDRNITRDRYRDKTRDVESDRNRRYHKYDDRDDGYGNRDRRHGYEGAEYRRDRDRDRKHASEEDRVCKDGHLKPKADRINRDEDDQKEYEERVDLELAEQEEDDPDRIKEKSRRLREAILQKYKAQQSQHEAPPQTAKALNEEPEEQPSQNLVATNADVKTNGQATSSIETLFDFGKQNETKADEKSTGAAGLGEGTPKSERSNDLFSDDIFGDSPTGVRKTGKGDGLAVERSGLHDNWDDPEGYYSFRFGEILDGRYEITAAHGKGVFSTVVRAKDLKAGTGDPEEVAIKIIRNNETMLKAGTEELVILKKLVGADPEDRRHCVRYLSHFKYRNHLCIVFESLHMNLREVLKKFGRNIGLKLTAVRAYAKQLFIALKHLKNCGVLHCDIKPDNMLVNDAKNVLKLCDFGNAMFAGKNEITPYLVSRFYRAPEIILGLSYDHPMDIWSVGCCLYELYTGKVLFPGATNNDMLRLHMELKGSFPKKMLRKGAFIEQHFDQDLNFLALEEDPVTKKTIRRPMVNIKPKDISTMIKGSPGEDPKMLANFKELLDKIFVLDPDKRLTVSQALSHPFITGK